MASTLLGDINPSEGRRFPMGTNDHAARGPVVHPNGQPAEIFQDSTTFQMHLNAEQRNHLPSNLRDMPSSYTYHYPNGIPKDYKMVPSRDGETPRWYLEDNLPVSFYTKPARAVRGIFSTNNGEIPARGPPHALPARELHLWSAEELQEKANAVRKKHWSVMKSMQKPTVWEDLYDYFDCYDIYFQGAINLWNLVLHLYHENQCLVRSLYNALSFEVGIWCDEWVAKKENKTKLDNFRNWEGNIFDILDEEDRKELHDMPSFNMELIRNGLLYRQSQRLGKAWARPTSYPANSLAAQWEKSSLHQWLAGQPVQDTPSGLAPAPTSTSLAIGGPASPSYQPSSAEFSEMTSTEPLQVDARNTAQKPIIVRGTTKQNTVGPQYSESVTARITNSNSEDSFAWQNALTPVAATIDKPREGTNSAPPQVFAPPSIPSNGSPLPLMANAGPAGSTFYPPPVRTHGHPFNTPLTTGPNGAPQLYLGPVAAAPVPGHHYHGPSSQANMTPRRFTNDRFSSSGYTTPIRGSMNSMGYPRIDSTQQPRNGPFKASSGASNLSHGQQRHRRESKGWEKVQNADESIHGPVFRRSPIKDSRPRGFSQASSKTDPICLNQHPKFGDRWAYTPCDCVQCQERNCSVYVQLNPHPQLPLEEVVEKVKTVMSQWGTVEKATRLKSECPVDFMAFFVKFGDDSCAAKVADTKDFVCSELQCTIRLGAMHHSKYGNAMRHDHGHHGMGNDNSSSQYSAWRSPSSPFPNKQTGLGFSQSQYVPYRQESRNQVSLDQYLMPCRQPSQNTNAQTFQIATESDPASPLCMGRQQDLPREKAELTKDTQPVLAHVEVQIKLPPRNACQPSAEAESQSKPPSEEAILDAEQTNKISSPQAAKGSPNKSNSNSIVVNLPTTPQKAESSHQPSEETGTPPNKVVLTPQNSELFVTPTKNSPLASTSGEREIETPSNEQKKLRAHSGVVTQDKKHTTQRSASLTVSPTFEQPISNSPTYGKGKYRKVFSQQDTSSVEVFDIQVPYIAGKPNPSAMSASTVADRRQPQQVEVLHAGHAFDDLIDVGRSQETLTIIAISEASTKKKNKSKGKKKNKKKPAPAIQGESGSSDQPASNAPTVIAVEQAPQAFIPAFAETAEAGQCATVSEFLAKIKENSAAEKTESKEWSEKPDPRETANKNFRANAGGSLRMPKNRKKQPAQLNFAARGFSSNDNTTNANDLSLPGTFDFEPPSTTSTTHMSFITAQESRSSDGSSQGMLLTPVTPASLSDKVTRPKPTSEEHIEDIDVTPKSNTLLNPQAKEFSSPVTREAVIPRVKLAPIPLKPGEHQRNLSQTSTATSHTMTPGSSPLREDDKQGNDKAAGPIIVQENTPAEQGPVKDDLRYETKQHSTAREVRDNRPVSQEARDEKDDWQVQHHKRDFSKNTLKQHSGNSPQRTHKHQQGRQPLNKNRLLPKKQKVQGQGCLQQPRFVSSPNNRPVSIDSKAEFPSLPTPTHISGLPPTSVWGKTRSASTAVATGTSSAKATAVKNEDSGNSSPEGDDGTQKRNA